MQAVFSQVATLEPTNNANTPVQRETVTPSTTASETLRKLAEEDFYELALMAGMLILCIVLAYYAFRKKPYRHHELSLYDDSIDESQLTTLPQALFEKRQKLFRRLACLAENGELHQVRVKHIMSLVPSTASSETPVAEIAAAMHEHRFRHMLVTDAAQNLLGLISDRDIGKREGETAGEIMSIRLTVVTPECEAIPAVTTMMNRGISSLPVVDEGKLVGILTTTDIMLIMQCLVLLGHRKDGETPALDQPQIPRKSVPAAPIVDSAMGTMTGIAALLQDGKLPPRESGTR